MERNLSPQWVPLVDAARSMRVSYHRAYNRLIEGRLRGRRFDGRWYVRRTDLEAYQREQKEDE